MRKNNILDVFLIKNDELTGKIIVTETSMSDHNIIQIETNVKIVEEKQNHQIKKSNLNCRASNFFNEDVSWASTDEKLMKCIRLQSTFACKFLKNMFCRRKLQETSKYEEKAGH